MAKIDQREESRSQRGEARSPLPVPRGGSERAAARSKNVWSRSGSKYRIRAITLLAVNVLLFAGVGSFAYWLRSGQVFAPTMEGYWDQFFLTFRFGQQTAVSLASLLLEPINVQDVPMQIPIVGLLMAALISIPILVSILYRFSASLSFIAVVGFLAVMPWLAITLLGSCVIASVRPFRSRFRFTSALLGLVPIVIYLALAWRGSASVVVGEIDPVDRIKFIAPWVLAVVAGALVFAVVLTIAKVVDYRPGAIAPLLAVMFGLPVGLFEFYIGRDELHYRLLGALERAHFADVDASLGLRQAARKVWERQPMPRRSWQSILEMEELKWQFLLTSDIGPVRTELAMHQAELTERCDWFREQFPTSRYTPNALFIKARALDMRIDPAEFRKTKWIRFYDSFPSPASRETWHIVVENRPHSILGAVGLLRLAQLDLRAGDISRGAAKLERLVTGFGSRSSDDARPNARDEGVLKGVLARDTPEACLDVPLDRLLLEARALKDLVAENRDPIYGYEPISGPRGQRSPVWFGLFDLDPRHERYIDNLERLKSAYPNCQIEDNVDLEIAKATLSAELKTERLAECVHRFPGRDAIPEALFRLGVAYKSGGQSAKSEGAFSRLFVEYPQSVWTEQATRFTPWPIPARLTEAKP